MRISISTFKNVRARVQRASDGSWHSGWVTHLSSEVARIRLQAFVSLRRDERFLCECYGDGALVRFQGLVVGQAGQEVGFIVSGALAFGPSQESVRIHVENVSGIVWDDTREANLILLDASPEALGGIADASFAPGAQLALTLEVGNRTYEAAVRVVNCRSEESQAGYYRLGLVILDASRLSIAVWKRLLEEQAAR